MRRWLAALLLPALLLTGCGVGEHAPLEDTVGLEPQGQTQAQAAEEPETEEIAVCTSQRPAESTASAGLTVEMERAVYDPSVERYTYFVRNDTESHIWLGEDEYRLQRWEDGAWRGLIWQEGMVSNLAAVIVQPGGSVALTCWMGRFMDTPETGQYRLAREIEAYTDMEGVGESETHTLYAEFAIGESIYTADTPYGFKPLEGLPENYGADTASENDVVFTYDGVKNDGAVEEFLFKSGLGANCQLRSVQDYGEGAPLVTDVIYERLFGNGCFLWRGRQNGVITEKRFSYLVTDGVDLYLSNGADWESTLAYGSDKTLLIPGGAAAFVPAVEEQTAHRLESNVIRYRIWSDDGVWSASLRGDIPSDDPPLCLSSEESTAFSVVWQKPGEGTGGAAYNLLDWDETACDITAMEWRDDGRLRLAYDTAAGDIDILYFNPVNEYVG